MDDLYLGALASTCCLPGQKEALLVQIEGLLGEIKELRSQISSIRAQQTSDSASLASARTEKAAKDVELAAINAQIKYLEALLSIEKAQIVNIKTRINTLMAHLNWLQTSLFLYVVTYLTSDTAYMQQQINATIALIQTAEIDILYIETTIGQINLSLLFLVATLIPLDKEVQKLAQTIEYLEEKLKTYPPLITAKENEIASKEKTIAALRRHCCFSVSSFFETKSDPCRDLLDKLKEKETKLQRLKIRKVNAQAYNAAANNGIKSLKESTKSLISIIQNLKDMRNVIIAKHIDLSKSLGAFYKHIIGQIAPGTNKKADRIVERLKAHRKVMVNFTNTFKEQTNEIDASLDDVGTYMEYIKSVTSKYKNYIKNKRNIIAATEAKIPKITQQIQTLENRIDSHCLGD